MAKWNLTALQREGLRWVVERVRAGELEEEFLIGWASNGAFIADYHSRDIPDKALTAGTLKAWARAGLAIISDLDGGFSYNCILTQAAYDAVDAAFVEVDRPLNDGRLRAFLAANFSKDELLTITHSLKIDHENINGQTKEAYARELVSYAMRRGMLWELAREALELE